MLHVVVGLGREALLHEYRHLGLSITQDILCSVLFYTEFDVNDNDNDLYFTTSIMRHRTGYMQLIHDNILYMPHS